MGRDLNPGETIVKPSERHPGRRAAAATEQVTQSSAEVAALKRDWIRGVPGESFRNWVEDAPEQVFLNFVRNAEDQFIEDMKQAALKFIHGLRGGAVRYDVKVTMAEATAAPAYEKLTDAEKAAVKLLIESQRQVEEKRS
jgi:hypothetical protein